MKFDIEAVKRKMLVKYPFFGSVVANVDYKENKNIPTAGTDGHVIHFNTEFLDGLTEDEQTFIFAHEVCHIAFNHILRSEGKDPRVWNIATDAVINAFLKRDGLKMVEGGVDMADAINYDAEHLYEKLLEENKDNGMENGNSPQQGDSSQSGGAQGSSGGTSNQSQSDSQKGDGQEGEISNQEFDGQDQNGKSSGKKKEGKKVSGSGTSDDEESNDVGHDTHDMWAEAVKKNKEGNKDKKDKENKIYEKGSDENKQEIEKKQEETEKLGEKESFKKNKEEYKKQMEELKRSLSRNSMGVGNSTFSSDRNVSDIGKARSIIDWRYILREAIKYDVDWSYKNASVEEGVVSANLEEMPLPETEIVVDTSGSINESLLKNFLRECKNILKHSKLKVGCFDTKFYGFEDVRTENDIEKMKFRGGGGTDFDVAVNAFTRRVENKIIFTDGEANMPKKPVDAIWIVFGNKKIKPLGGKVIYINEQQLSKLYSFKIDNKTTIKRR